MIEVFNRLLLLLVLLIPAAGRAQAKVCISDKENQLLIMRITQKTEQFCRIVSASVNEANSENIQHVEDLAVLVGQLTDKRLTKRYVPEVLRAASKIEQWLLGADVKPQVVTEWAKLHSELEILAEVYRVKWTDSLVDREFVANLEQSITRFYRSIEQVDEPADRLRISMSNDLRTVARDLLAAAHELNDRFPDREGMAPSIEQLRSGSKSLTASLKSTPLRAQTQVYWRDVSLQLQLLIRVLELDREHYRVVERLCLKSQ